MGIEAIVLKREVSIAVRAAFALASASTVTTPRLSGRLSAK